MSLISEITDVNGTTYTIKDAAARGDLANKADKADTVLDTNLSHGKKEGTTVGYGSIAFGYNVKASNYFSQAVGYQTVATGQASHAEGGKTVVADTTTYNGSTYTYGATGQYSHSEGQSTIATNTASHAEGIETMAISSCSHAEGNATKATSYSAHAEGLGGTFTLNGISYTSGAHGTASHSEGYSTHANANGMPGNHAEGYATVSRGGASHSEGNNTDASGQASHAEGVGGSFTLNGNTYYSGALGQASHSEGYQTYANANMMPGSHAEGYNTVSRGGASHSEGYNTDASGQASHAEGKDTIAGSYFSHSEGLGSQSYGAASHAEGNGTYALGKASHVVGRYNYTDINNESFSTWVSGKSYAVGDMVFRSNKIYACKTANSDTTFTSSKWEQMADSGEYKQFAEIVGNGNSQKKSNARAVDWEGNEYLMGDLYIGCDSQSANGVKVAKTVNPEFTGTFSHNRKTNTTVGINSVAIGDNVTASGNLSFAEGNDTTASGDVSHAEGNGTTASGSVSHAEGYGTISSAYTSHAEGGSTQASNSYAHAEGYGSKSTGSTTHAEGWSSTASGDYSHAEGYNTKATGTVTHAEGTGTQANGERSHAEGEYSNSNGQSSHAEGAYTTAQGQYSHAEGYSTKSFGSYSHAEGNGTLSVGEKSHAEGTSTTATGNNSHVSGKYNAGDFDTWHVWTSGTSYEVGDKVKRTIAVSNTNIVEGYICKVANSSTTFTNSEWNKVSDGVYAEIVGNGADSSHKSNARTLDWEGNEYLNGDLYVGCNPDSTGGTKVAKITDIKDPVNQYDDQTEFPAAGDEESLYIAKDTNEIFRWDDDDEEYVSVGSSGNDKVDIAQGVANAGKIMRIGSDGNLAVDGTMTILSYGNSTWNDFITAYTSKSVVYCRASSNSNPGSGSQTRLAFMAYVNNAETPTEVEFQYYRSVSSHTASQQGDQVFVYKLTSTGGWTVTTREAASKVVAGTNMSSSYSSGTLTLNGNYSAFGGASAIAAGSAGLVPAPAAGSQKYFLMGDGTWAEPPSGKFIEFDLDDVSNVSGSYTHTTTISDVLANMKVVMVELSNPDAFLDTVTFTTADGSITLSCDEVVGTSTVHVGLEFVAGADAITSSEFDVLNARIGTLSSLTTTDKSSVVNAVNEVNAHLVPVDISSDISGQSNVTFDTKFVYKIGKMVLVNIRFKAKSAISGSDSMMTGFPAPAGNYTLKFPINISNGSNVPGALYQNGYLSNDWGAIAVNSGCFINFAYPCA